MKTTDLGKDPILNIALKLAIPSMLAQFVNVFYTIIDRMFIGNIPEIGEVAWQVLVFVDRLQHFLHRSVILSA